jgi:hypothetical protein
MNQFLPQAKKFYLENKYKIFSGLIIFVIVIPGIIMPTLKQPDKIDNIGIGGFPQLPDTPKFGNINFPELPQLKAPNLTSNLQITETVKNNIKFGNFGQTEEIPLTKPSKMLLPEDINTNSNLFTIDQLKVKKDIQALQLSPVNGTKGIIYVENSDLKELVSDKFPVDTNVKITYKNKSMVLKVGSKRLLSSSTLGIVNRQVFKDLGVDPLQVTELEVMMEQV